MDWKQNLIWLFFTFWPYFLANFDDFSKLSNTNNNKSSKMAQIFEGKNTSLNAMPKWEFPRTEKKPEIRYFG